MHPLIVGEIAVGSIANRKARLFQLDRLQPSERASDDITRHMIESHRLYGRGLSYIDLQLLASTRLTLGAMLWTNDKRLAAAASALGVEYQPAN